MKRLVRHPADIDSSFLVFGTLLTFVLAYGMAEPFESYNRLFAFCAIVFFAIYYAVAWYLLEQYYEGEYIITHFALSMLVYPLLAGAGLNWLFGALQDQAVPVIHGFGIFDWRVSLVEAKPSVFAFYGGFTFSIAILLAGFIDDLISPRLHNFLPARVKRTLHRVDERLDDVARRESDSIFLTGNRGLWLALGFIIVLALANILLISFG